MKPALNGLLRRAGQHTLKLTVIPCRTGDFQISASVGLDNSQHGFGKNLEETLENLLRPLVENAETGKSTDDDDDDEFAI